MVHKADKLPDTLKNLKQKIDKFVTFHTTLFASPVMFVFNFAAIALRFPLSIHTYGWVSIHKIKRRVLTLDTTVFSHVEKYVSLNEISIKYIDYTDLYVLYV